LSPAPRMHEYGRSTHYGTYLQDIDSKCGFA
jgi:hypothetical protein